MAELLPTKTLYAVGEPVRIEVRGAEQRCLLRVLSLGEVRREVAVDRDGIVVVGELPAGGYGLALVCNGIRLARSAVQVVEGADRRTVLRYSFVASYHPGRDIGGLQDNLRRLHLTAVQCYDWGFRHADLMGGGPSYADPLGNPVALSTVRAIVDCCHAVGADALGYAAVYAVGNEEWQRWSAHALLTAAGAAYGLGDFLRLVDPAAPAWTEHLGDDLADAVAQVGFDGFHLDQYGYPKQAVTADGGVVDVAARFVQLIERLRERLPGARLVFNNVNGFPTWATARTAQDAVYLEVWEPIVGYADLAALVSAARAAGSGKPVCVAAYQHVYATAPVEQADQATALTMATLFSHGATHLLAGEADRVLVDPYYVNNHVAARSTADLLHRWYDFLVEHHDLLMPAGVAEVTAAYAGDHNDDVDVRFAGAAVSGQATAGTVWRRVTQVGDWLVVHLVNLVGQQDTTWDAPHQPPVDPGAGTLRFRRVVGGPAVVQAADPDGSGHLEPVQVRADGDHATAELPALHTWLVVLLRQR